MAKNRNSAQQRKLKLANNATSRKPLRCSTKDCEEDFYIYNPLTKKRQCREHYKQAKLPKSNARLDLLRSLGLVT